MSRKLIQTLGGFLIGFLVLSVCYGAFMHTQMESNDHTEELMLVQQIRQLTNDEQGNNPASLQLDEMKETLRAMENTMKYSQFQTMRNGYVMLVLLYVMLLFAYIYYKLLRPFRNMEHYAQELANGNFELPLRYERTNFFGSFTWAFDHMRKEIQFARTREANAINENKTIIASLSHDIKTPIASIRAYAEGLEANLATDYEKRQRYVNVIIKKCDEVSKLTNDLMLHSLSELDKLEIKLSCCSMQSCLKAILKDLEYPKLCIKEPLEDPLVMIDEGRLAQVMENLIQNARKYAPDTCIDIYTHSGKERYQIHIRDHGAGIFPEDMPFVFDKFYRGRNTEKIEGSGLGLYIVNYITQQMNGRILLNNHSDGLEVMLDFPIVRK